MSKYTKAIVAVVAFAANAIYAAISAGPVTNAQWFAIAVSILTTIGVYVFPNSK